MSSSSSADDNYPPLPKKRIVIAGSGIIGTSTAHYLTKDHLPSLSSLTIVDPTGSIAPAASGKAGGFLALDWNDHHPPTGRLARRSFALHEELALTPDGIPGGKERVMYRRTTAAAVSVKESSGGGRKPSGKKLDGVEWVHGDGVVGASKLGDESTIAQVHPKLLCEAMWEKVTTSTNDSRIGNLVMGRVVAPVYENNNDGGTKTLVGAELEDGTILPADAILFACGPWTTATATTSNQLPMYGVKYHSAIVPTDPQTLNQSVFFDGYGDPEVYPRPDNTAYCTGFPDPPVVVTERPGEVEVRPEAIQKILNAVRLASTGGGGGGEEKGWERRDPTVEQSCYLPTTPDGVPAMGELAGGGCCYVAAGHGCWGILLGPGTGEAMASLIMKGKSTEWVDMDAFRPSRFGW